MMMKIVVMIMFIIAIIYSSSGLLNLSSQSSINRASEIENISCLRIKNNCSFCCDMGLAVLCPINDFSAIVFKDGGRAKARSSRGDIIAEGKDRLDDSEVIQAAIDGFESGGKIFIKSDHYFINSTIILKGRIRLEFEQGATLIPTKNIDLIQIKPGSELSGGIFDVSNIEFTKSAILLDGTDKFGIANGALIEHVKIQNLEYIEEPRGNAILFVLTNTTPSYISGVNVKNIVIYGAFKNGILLSKPMNFSSGWINGNSFDGIIGEGAEYFINIDNIYGYGTDGNNFRQIQYQSLNNSKCAITVGGSYNSFDCLVWDWQLDSGNYIISLLENSSANYIQKYTSTGKIDDKGHDNIILPVSL